MFKALLYNEVGSPDVLFVGELEDQPLADGEVRISVRAAGLNPFDFKIRSGQINPPNRILPSGVGQDFAGVITEVSGDLRYFSGEVVELGDEVFGWADQSSIRESLVATPKQIVLKPAGLTWEAAGSLQTAGLTAIACFEYMNLKSDDVVLVSAAAGGVGIIFSQLAVTAGIRVIGSASEMNFDLLRSIGVEPVGYGPNSASEIRALGGVTAVLDNVGKPTLDLAIDELAVPKDRICSIGDHGYSVSIGVGDPGMYERVPSNLSHLADLVVQGVVRLPSPHIFNLFQARQAYELLESRHYTGKIVIKL